MARVTDWVRRQPTETWVTLFLVAGSVLFVFGQLEPRLLLRNTTPAGGDMGAHVWAPAFLRDELLPRFRFSGWTPDWYAGFPAYHFYMVVPSLAIVLLDVVFLLPYNIAFKLVSVSGLVALPVAAWAMGRLARLPFPAPAALAVATVPFVFDRSFTIYGGNAASTLAGEFAFTISLCFALLFIGMVLRGLDTGGNRAWAAVLLGLCALCHLIPALFALIAAVVALAPRVALAVVVAVSVTLLFAWPFGMSTAVLVTAVVMIVITGALTIAGRWPDRVGLAAFTENRLRAWWLASVAAVGSLLSAFWTVPFLLRRSYLNDMGWERTTAFWEPLFPGRIGEALSSLTGGSHSADISGDITAVAALALIGAGTALVFRRRFGTFVVALAAVTALGFRLAPQGRLWNARLLPFWYLCLYLLAALAVVEVVGALAVLASKDPQRPRRGVLVGGPVVAALFGLVAVAMPLRALPFGSTSEDKARYSWMGLTTTDRSFIPGWVDWNYSGYEGKDAFPEYQQIVATMSGLGESNGCGRAMWEYESDLNRFGTPMALMLLPYWTDGCIGSMEGLYFEASATTPYHFLNQSELSAVPSRAQRDLPYGPLDVDLGVDHLQLLGVRYYMAFSDAAVAQADGEEELRPLASSGRWRVYEVANADLVEPLAHEPVVVDDVAKGGKDWQDLAVGWYLDRSRWDVMLAADGPESWGRVGRDDGVPETARYPDVAVTKIDTDADSISFEVDQVGTPMLVKASYFPNWTVSGAEGPFRVAPNLMIVVPTDNVVKLTYGRTGVDWLGVVLTLVGVGLTVVLARRRPLRVPPPPPPPADVWSASPPTDPTEPGGVLATVGASIDRDRWGPHAVQ